MLTSIKSFFLIQKIFYLVNWERKLNLVSYNGKEINKSGYLVIVVTNQPVIARGDCTWEDLHGIHNKMETELGKEGSFVDAIYICPHHPDKGFEGERSEYKYECNCRKPAPGLLLQAAQDLNIDLSKSFMIGDSERDVDAGKTAGCKDSFKVETNMNYSLVLEGTNGTLTRADLKEGDFKNRPLLNYSVPSYKVLPPTLMRSTPTFLFLLKLKLSI